MSLLSRFGFLFALLGAISLSAQTDIARPQPTAAISRQMVPPGGAAVPVDLKNHFTIPNETGDKFVQFDTVYGKFNVVLKGSRAPIHVENFLRYVNEGAYDRTFFHRTFGGTETTVASIAQAGGFRLPYSTKIPTHDSIALEGTLTHEIYTLAAARTDDPNSATNQFFFNLVDNTGNFFPGSGTTGSTAGRYTVYGRVVGGGGALLNTIGMLRVYNMLDGSVNTTAFQTIPLRDKVPNILTDKNLVIIHSIKEVPLYATGDETSVLTFSAESSNPEIAQVSITGSTLNILPGSVNGTTQVTVYAAEAGGNDVSVTFEVETNSELSIARPPRDHTIAAGDAVVFEVEARGAGLSYQWQRNENDIPGATAPQLFIRDVNAERDAGKYTVEVSNTIGTVTSAIANLTVVDGSVEKSRLTNLSVRGFVGRTSGILIAGFVTDGPIWLMTRGIGPTLAEFDVENVLADPEIKVVRPEGNVEIFLGGNNDWSEFDGSVMGAFPLPVGSKDAVHTQTSISGANSVKLSGVGDTIGNGLIELYEGTAESTGFLVNLSSRALILPNDFLIGGFTLTGATSRTVLVRAIGPGLEGKLIEGDAWFQDPRLTLRSTKDVLIAQNDNWGGSDILKEAFSATGAFQLTNGASKDAAILVTLEPGSYTAVINGPTGHTGIALLEVYLLR